MELLGAVLFAWFVWLLLSSKGQTQSAQQPWSEVPPPAPPQQGVDVAAPIPAMTDTATGSSVLDDITQAIYQFEGGKAGNRNVVNNNPGNLVSGPGMTGTAGGYATFADAGDGWDALGTWIKEHARQHPDWDFYDLFNYYLRGDATGPKADAQGDSNAYAEYVANYIGAYPTDNVQALIGG